MQDIDDLIFEIAAGINENDEQRAGIAAVALLGGFLKDVRRIADALEKRVVTEIKMTVDASEATAHIRDAIQDLEAADPGQGNLPL